MCYRSGQKIFGSDFNFFILNLIINSLILMNLNQDLNNLTVELKAGLKQILESFKTNVLMFMGTQPQVWQQVLQIFTMVQKYSYRRLFSNNNILFIQK